MAFYFLLTVALLTVALCFAWFFNQRDFDKALRVLLGRKPRKDEELRRLVPTN